MNINKLKYFIHSLTHIRQRPVCPYCKSTEFTIIDRKYLVTRLLECTDCHLYYRHPVDPKEFNADFYQDDYKQSGLTTDLPGPDKLKILKETKFANSEMDCQEKIRLLKCLPEQNQHIKIVDYGTSWGYMSYQFRNAGMDVQSSEISAPRARFGNENLGLNIQTNENALLPGNDVFFSSHVIEHHPDIMAMVRLSKSLLAEGGYFVAFCPNG